MSTPTQRTTALTPVQVLGGRYRVERLLGRGGMGEVWQAFDLKLRVEVALKFLLPELSSEPHLIEMLRREVRSARDVASPHVCRVFDLIELDGREVVSMEYVDGTTLQALLAERSPLDLDEARRLASQLLTGLQAIHDAGLIHRDLKPANVMLTRAGRAVIMDFGISKSVAETQTVAVVGTPAYMAPEQMMGGAVDRRADLFAVGMMLAEMVAPGGVREPARHHELLQSLRRDPPGVPPGPWEAAIRRALAVDPRARFASAAELARALGDGGHRVEEGEDLNPYPGLSTFTAEKARFFFGRELEVESAWRKLHRVSMVALIGPSGVGKSSFLRAGLIPAAPEGWKVAICSPGDAPFTALGQSLVGEFAGQTEAMQELFRLHEIERSVLLLRGWRQRGRGALLVLDQFEELFTLNPPEVQGRFAELLGRLALEADIHVLISMRDDFFFQCHPYPALRPLFSEAMPLAPLAAADLRRALVEPARLCGYAFEDEALVAEMLAEVEGERGALPLLAFAAARLWELRDRTTGVIGRRAYEEIGHVAGALAQHAEATLERIGREREDVVRELFRNLVTAQGTRAVRERDELLSVFPDRRAAEDVLRALVDARLLTSFELPETRGSTESRHRIEIVHESLLTSWPRLVRWRTQDTEGAQLRDQLRQASQLWKERGASDDLLWTGTAFREFELWRERYPGGLTETEEAFALAMVARAGRQRRRRRLALTTAFAILMAVVVVIGWSWQGERRSRLSAEANKLFALGQLELEADPAAALAYAVAGLELADTPTGRMFALEALARHPAAGVTPQLAGLGLMPVFLDFGPDGRNLAAGGQGGVFVLPEDGGPATSLRDTFSLFPRTQRPQFSPDGRHLIWMSNEDSSLVRVWSVEQKKDVRTFRFEGATLPIVRGGKLLLLTDVGPPGRAIGVVTYPATEDEFSERWKQTLIREWLFGDEAPRIVGRWNSRGISAFDVDAGGRWVAYPKGREVRAARIDALESGQSRLVGEHTAEVRRVRFDPAGDRLASSDENGEIRLWSMRGEAGAPLRVIPGTGPLCGLDFDPAGRTLAVAHASADKSVNLWDLAGPQGADPVVLRRRESSLYPAVDFHPNLPWLAVGYHNDIAFWPLDSSAHRVLRGDGGSGHTRVVFAPDGRSVTASFAHGGIRIWSLEGGLTQDLWKPRSPTAHIKDFALDSAGGFAIAGTSDDGAFEVSMAGGSERPLPDVATRGNTTGMVVSPDGRLAAGVRMMAPMGVLVWDLAAGTVREVPNTGDMSQLNFAGDGRLLYTDKIGDVHWWDPGNGSSGPPLARVPRYPIWSALTRDGRHLFVTALTGISERDSLYTSEAMTAGLFVYDLERRTSRRIESHGNRVYAVVLDRGDSLIATGDRDGIVRVGPITGEEPHLLLKGRPGITRSVAISPDGKWIAGGSHFEPAVDLWRIPTGRPIQTLPYEEFLQRMRARTCMSVIPDRASPTGYRLDQAAYTGWRNVPGR